MKKIFVLTAFCIVFLSLDKFVFASEVEISENGSGSVSSIDTNVGPSVTISQSNDAQIQNSVNVAANTGDITANSNSGSVGVTTGDIDALTSITNSGNSSVIESTCCSDATTNLTISKNAADSNNNISFSLNNQTNIEVSNQAKIINNSNLNLNTGEISASKNSGEVEVTTGNISVLTEIKNQGVNNSIISAQIPGSSLNLKIIGNGQDSINNIKFQEDNKNLIYIENYLDLLNIKNINGSTGNNNISSNQGDVFLATGDIFIDSLIKNTDINTSQVSLNCCPSEDNHQGGKDPPAGGQAPSSNSQNNPSSPPSSSSTSPGEITRVAGEVLAAASKGQILPISGSYFLYLMTLVSLLMFISGLYLRFHPGCSPGIRV